MTFPWADFPERLSLQWPQKVSPDNIKGRRRFFLENEEIFKIARSAARIEKIHSFSILKIMSLDSLKQNQIK